MKIVVLDGYTENPGDLTWNVFEELGDVVVYDRTEEAKIVERIKEAEIVITNKTPITKKTIDMCPNMKYIGVLATGYNVVDVGYAKEREIPVCNVPTYGTESVGQFAIALLLEICHNIGIHNQSVQEGEWANNIDWCYWKKPLIELAGKTMGIIGFGRIGQTTGKIAGALGMNVVVVDKFESEKGRKIAEYVDLDTLFLESDVIVLHCPLFDDTEGIINKNTIKKMKDGVIIINNSRGPLIVEKDLADALNSGKVHAAGVDVVNEEPIRNDNPLLKAKNCIITPHISWAAKEPRERIMKIAAENISNYMSGKIENNVW